MDRLLRRKLDAIARNRTSGATELALEAVTALQAWLRRNPKPTETELLEIARALLRAQPSMAPILRLANSVALAADHKNPPEAVARAATNTRAVLRMAPSRIARRFAAALRRRPRWSIATYSYSSTVVEALRHARPRIRSVRCSESRPGLEGRAMARRLASAGIHVVLETDASLFSRAQEEDLIVLGADQIGERSFVNKIGTETIVARASDAGKPVWVLADTIKFLPRELSIVASRSARRPQPGWEVWRNPPRRVAVSNDYFEPTQFRSGVRVLTERGWMTPAQVRRELGKIRVSPRWKDVANWQVHASRLSCRIPFGGDGGEKCQVEARRCRRTSDPR